MIDRKHDKVETFWLTAEITRVAVDKQNRRLMLQLESVACVKDLRSLALKY